MTTWIIKDQFSYPYYAMHGYWTERQCHATRFRLRGAAKMALADTMRDRPRDMPRARVVRLRTTEARK